MTEVLAPISADHSPILFFLSKEKGCFRGKGIWRFNSSLAKGQNYIIEIKKMIRSFCTVNKATKMRALKNIKFEYLLLTIQNI